MRFPQPRRHVALIFVGAIGLLGISSASGEDAGHTEKPTSFFQKKKVTVAITDSGLGGLAVMAEAVKKLKEARQFERADFVFFNALFSNEGGYNALPSREEKIRVFQSALESLASNFHPDLILVACNTLSAIFPDTAFSRESRIPVIGIIEPGVELIARGLHAHPGSSVIIFGTPTTISEATHRTALLRQGFSPDRIYLQACPELEAFIERDNAGEETGMLISGFVEEARQRMPAAGPPFLASLNCTHYGYSLPLWEKAFREAESVPLEMLNPNRLMADAVLRPELAGRHQETKISARVVSMVEIDAGKIASLGRWLHSVSSETAEALRRYEHAPSLFEWKKFVSPSQTDLPLPAYEAMVLELCRGVVELFEAGADSIWPGYDLSRQPFLAYIPERWALLFNPAESIPEFASPPADWPPFRGKVLYHPGKYGDLAGQLAFDYSVGPIKTVAVGLPASPPQDLKNIELSLFGFIIHEAFHQYQAGHFGEIPWEREERYPILNAENSALAFLEMELLADALGASAARRPEERDSLLRQFVAVRENRWSRGPRFVKSYEQGQEIREGTAQYVETQALLLAKSIIPKLPSSRALPHLGKALAEMSFPGSLLEAFRARMSGRHVPPEDMLRNRIYPVGATLGLLLDELEIEWKARAQAAGEGFEFHRLLAERLELKPDDLPRLFESACRNRDCEGLRAAA